jgi:transposase/integrase
VVIEEVREDGDVIVVACRLRKNAARRCGICSARSGLYDQGDAGITKVFIEADAPRVRCRAHGVTVAAVPWARHGAGHTRAFDDQVAWPVTHTSKTAVVELMRVAWRTVGAIAARVVADSRKAVDPFDGLERIGIDEISYRRGHKYLMVVVDHDTGRLVWAAAGHDKATLQTFFDLLGPERAAKIRLVSADAAEWIGEVAMTACPNAELCLDPFHIVRWATQALDVVRRWVWNVLRRLGLAGRAKHLKGCRYALWKNPDNLTDRQTAKLAWIAKHNQQLYRAYLLKEQLRLVFAHRGDEAVAMGDAWLSWARRSQIPAFVELYHLGPLPAGRTVEVAGGVQRVVMPVTGAESWTVVDADWVPVEPAERYLAHLAGIERSPNTVRAYAHGLRLWFEFLDGRGLAWDSTGVEDVSRFVAWLRAPADNVIVLDDTAAVRSAATVNRHLAALFGFYDFHARSGVVLAADLVAWRRVSRGSYKPFLHHVTAGQPIPTRPVKLRVPRRLPATLSVEEITVILAACGRLRDRFLFALLAETGMRIGQALGLRHEDFVSRQRQVMIVPRDDNANGARAKCASPATVPVSAPLVRLYSDYMHTEYRELDSDYVFVNLWSAPRRGGAEAGMQNARPEHLGWTYQLSERCADYVTN